MESPLAFMSAAVGAVPVHWYLTLGLFMFVCGGIGVVVRRSPVLVFMCIELMLNAVNLTFLAFAKYQPMAQFTAADPMQIAINGQMMVMFVAAVAAAEVAVGLGIIMAIFRLRAEVDVDEMSTMRG